MMPETSAHTNCSNKVVGTNVNRRVTDAILIAKKVQWLPISKMMKSRIIRTAVPRP